jgi:hypothetical protein
MRIHPSLMLAALAGCATPGAGRPAAAAPAVATAGLGERVRVGDVRVLPLAVLEDSRCPERVACIWAGRLRLTALLSGLPGEAELLLGTPHALPGGGTLTLIAATRPAARFTFRRD